MKTLFLLLLLLCSCGSVKQSQPIEYFSEAKMEEIRNKPETREVNYGYWTEVQEVHPKPTEPTKTEWGFVAIILLAGLLIW